MASFKPELVNYEILECVGEGLTSSVHKAVRSDSRGHSRQLVALKVLKDESSIPVLRREFETLARLRSLHCGRVLGWENDGDQAALVLEWIEGETIDRLAKEFLLDESEIEEIVSQIATGLRDLRDQGLHHGDLHPRNVIVDVEGRVRIVDFGTAPNPRPGIIHGAPAYLAPEIWAGERTSYTSDLFALGMIAHDMKTRFAEVPPSSGARERAERFAKTDSGLTAMDPEKRNAATFSSERDAQQVRTRIGRRVADLLAMRAEHSITKVFSMGSQRMQKRWKTPLAASLLAVLSTLSISVRAEAPAEVEVEPATLEIRSHRWVEMEINGEAAGFSPLSVRGLRPGFHRLRWRGPAGVGEARVQVSAGRVLRLSEADLARFSEVVNR